ncbi:hypothetical protein Tco_1453389 [Tanacetum coccineum]
MKEMRDRCNSYGGPHLSSECYDKLMGRPKGEEANYAYGGYRGNYYGRSFKNWRDRQPRDDNRNLQPREDNPSNPPTSEKKFEESDFKKTITQTNLNPNPTNDKPYRPPPAENEHVNAIFIQSDKTYEPPVNPNAKTTIIHDDSEDEANEAEKEVESSSSKQTKSNSPPLKAAKNSIPSTPTQRKDGRTICQVH